ITMPPLRERRSDIPVLVQHFLEKIGEKTNQKPKRVSADALKMLTQYNWPGNVRELANTIERAVVLASDNTITPTDLLIMQDDDQELQPKCLKDQEKEIVLKALEECEGNKTRTAEVLGVSLRWLHYKLSEWNISRKRSDEEEDEE
ncbi:sigma-54-dependent Fis family transcriptional regulator, partial [bacterium]|nr:sigma-54-dependent Fis family transcriptional regulator [bacterium]